MLIAYKTIADIVSKSVTLVVTMAAARALSAGEFGVLALAMTTGWLLGVASDAGLPLHLAKAVARDGAGTAIVPQVLRLRGSLALVAAAIGVAIAIAIAPGQWLAAFVVIVVAQILGAGLELVSHFYRGIGRSDIESTLTLAHRTVAGIAALTILAWWPSLLALAMALAVPPALAVVISLAITRRLRARAGTEPRDARLHTADYLPIGLGIIVSALYFRCDVYFIEWWHGVETVGVYNGAFRIVEALRLLPAAILAVQFPALCRASDLRPLRTLSMKLALAGVATAAVVYFSAPLALSLAYGDRFVTAAPALRVLALAVPLFFVNYALTHQLIGWEGQRAYLLVTIAALVTNVAGNMMLIPSEGMTGAAISTLFTEAVVGLGCVVALMVRKPGGLLIAAPEVGLR